MMLPGDVDPPTIAVVPNKPRAGLVQVAIRLDPETMRRIEFRVEQLKREHPGILYDRLDVIREALAKLPEPPEGWMPGKK